MQTCARSVGQSSTPSTAAPTLYADGSVAPRTVETSLDQQDSSGLSTVPRVEVDAEHYDVLERTPIAASDPRYTGWSAEEIARGQASVAQQQQHAGEGNLATAASSTFLVHLADRKQAEAQLRSVGTEGGYLLRAKSQQELSAGSVAMSYLAKGSTVIHHKFARSFFGGARCCYFSHHTFVSEGCHLTPGVFFHTQLGTMLQMVSNLTNMDVRLRLGRSRRRTARSPWMASTVHGPPWRRPCPTPKPRRARNAALHGWRPSPQAMLSRVLICCRAR